MLDAPAEPVTPALAAADPAPAPAASPEATPAAPVDPMANAAETFYPDDAKPDGMVDDLKPSEEKPAEPKPEDKPAETPEEKAAREAAETPEQKAAREAEEAKAKENSAPETYEDFTVPEGMTLDPKIDTDFKALAKELNLPQAAAQRLIDLQVNNAKAQAEAAQAAINNTQTEWQTAMAADKEFGGDKLQASLALANKAVKQFGDPELKTLLAGPLGDNPALVRLMARVGKAVSEDAVIHGGKPQSSSPEAVLYPNLK